MISYESLTPHQKWQCELNYQNRKVIFERWKSTGFVNSDKTVLIVGDRPGPKAICDTPFFGRLHCGGWLNANMIVQNISEFRLFWLNASDTQGVTTDPNILLSRKWQCIALGHEAENWLKQNGQVYMKFDHPQYHRRFKAKKEYPFLSYLKVIT